MGYNVSLLLVCISLGILLVAATTDDTKQAIAKDAPKIAKDPGYRRRGLIQLLSLIFLKIQMLQG